MTKVKRADDRKALEQWARRNFADLARLERPNWPAIAERLAQEGTRDARGNPPSPTAVRLAFRRVRMARQAAQAKREEPAAVAETVTPAPTETDRILADLAARISNKQR